MILMFEATLKATDEREKLLEYNRQVFITSSKCSHMHRMMGRARNADNEGSSDRYCPPQELQLFW